MPTFQWATAWRRDDPKLVADAIDFWTQSVRLRREGAERRASQLCSMAYADGKLVGLSTVTFMDYPFLHSRFAFYRAAVAPEFRRQELAILLTRHTLITMEGWSLEHPEEKLQGIAAIIEADELGPKAHNPVWSEYYGNLNLAGFTQKGEQVRVAWFRHARLEL
jgi:hypothetical protein